MTTRAGVLDRRKLDRSGLERTGPTRPPKPRSVTKRRRSAPRTPVFMTLLALCVSLNLIGLVMVLSASSVTAQEEYGNPWYYLQRQQEQTRHFHGLNSGLA